MANGQSYQGWGISVLRIVVGVVFLMHGWQKFGMGFDHVSGFLGSLDFPVPMVCAVILTLLEFVGGIALVLGLATRWVAALLAVEMLVALGKVHLGHGFFYPPGVEYPLTLLAANIALALAGGGPGALDGLRGRGRA